MDQLDGHRTAETVQDHRTAARRSAARKHYTNRPAPAEMKAAEKFAAMEWAVLPDHRGIGVGRSLWRAVASSCY